MESDRIRPQWRQRVRAATQGRRFRIFALVMFLMATNSVIAAVWLRFTRECTCDWIPRPCIYRKGEVVEYGTRRTVYAARFTIRWNDTTVMDQTAYYGPDDGPYLASRGDAQKLVDGIERGLNTSGNATASLRYAECYVAPSSGSPERIAMMRDVYTTRMDAVIQYCWTGAACFAALPLLWILCAALSLSERATTPSTTSRRSPTVEEVVGAIRDKCGVEGSLDESTALSECPVCLERLGETCPHLSRLPCNHYFHFDCLKDWIERGNGKKCPLCQFRLRRVLSVEPSDTEKGTVVHTQLHTNSCDPVQDSEDIEAPPSTNATPI
uniref:RING-type domain-containing protein n=1 Tax=Compsopogon caeruleus TaxID=31354 RepID=A0A7S1TJI1_9RHOD|mmetsp:Transcript_7406/g.15115  ORF Transcript_7406/g.15115 Transcript_7406/m.15115 type:complete len:325 (+) Transcript_7406:383-1357(+)|eukprot:CAMPEP_0184679340 /NCGR_PEP_ID=MMETSP0312-20130426/2185_1 /TAXON_ID=31354 /ORGANISM="Compsopogon coeruleus, Strain SAG 36.94" /LENGTH=324 /DNA_ID=CAMNT_0027128731 /DNA_START=355 /DNA_END=1329 /DNA_ORIENTATION=+